MKIDFLKGKLWLCLPAIVAGMLDVIVTLLGQPAEYWKGSYNVVNELNPIGHWFLTLHPLAFIGYDILELVIVSIIITVLPMIISKSLSIFYTIGSAKAVYNWMAGSLHLGFWISNLMLVIPTLVLVFAFEKISEHKNSR